LACQNLIPEFLGTPKEINNTKNNVIITPKFEGNAIKTEKFYLNLCFLKEIVRKNLKN